MELPTDGILTGATTQKLPGKDALDADAARLFLERLRGLRPDYTVTYGSGRAVRRGGRMCWTLRGACWQR